MPARPRLYRTTENFLRAFHLTSLEDLPEMPELMNGEGQQMRLDEDGAVVDPSGVRQTEPEIPETETETPETEN